jgi:hypothetical protein
MLSYHRHYPEGSATGIHHLITAQSKFLGLQSILWVDVAEEIYCVLANLEQ